MATNFALAAFKAIGFLMSGSSSILASAIDSLSGGVNQLLLLYGANQARRPATNEHQFGFGKESYFWSLVATSVAFLGGAIFTVGYGIYGIINHSDYKPIGISIFIIFIALLLKSLSFYISFERFTKDRTNYGRSITEHIKRSSEISTVSIMIQDIISLFGLSLAFIGVLLTILTHSSIWDNAFSIIIGLLMGGLGWFLIMQNHRFLLDRSDAYLTAMARNTWNGLDYVEKIHSIQSITQNSDVSILLARIKLKRSIYDTGLKTGSIDSIASSMRKEITDRVPRAKHVFIEFSS